MPERFAQLGDCHVVGLLAMTASSKVFMYRQTKAVGNIRGRRSRAIQN